MFIRVSNLVAQGLALSVVQLHMALGEGRSSHGAGASGGSGTGGAASALPGHIIAVSDPRDLQVTDAGNCSTSTTADGNSVTVCREEKYGLQVQYVIHGDDNQLCYFVDGLPCWNSYLCPSSSSNSLQAYLDCRNLPRLDQTQGQCWSVDCDGACLPALTNSTSSPPNLASGTNGCNKIAYACASFTASGHEFENCTYIDVLGDGTRVAVKTEGAMGIPVSCWADVGGISCDCRSNCSASGEISYDCTEFSQDPCAATACGGCTYSTSSPHQSPVPVPSSPAPVTAPAPRRTSVPAPAPTGAPVRVTTSTPAALGTTQAPTLPCTPELVAWGQCMQAANLDARTCVDCYLGYISGVSTNSTCADISTLICSYIQNCEAVCGASCRPSLLVYQTCVWQDCFDGTACPGDLTTRPPVAAAAPSRAPSSSSSSPVVAVPPAPAPSTATPASSSTGPTTPTPSTSRAAAAITAWTLAGFGGLATWTAVVASECGSSVF